MRSGLLCLLCGCNQIFGSHAVSQLDAPPGGEPVLFHMSLTLRNVDTTQGADPDLIMPTSSALPDAHVQVGLVGGPLSDVAIDGDGNFDIPQSVTGDNGFYRLVYTPPDGVPVEVQANVLEAHFVVSRLGRPDAMPAPGNARLPELFPMFGPNPTFFNLHVFSIGTFAARIAGQQGAIGGSSTEWTTNTTMADGIASMSGGLYTPDSGKGDKVVVIDGANGDPNTAVGFSIGTMTKFATDGTANLTLSPWKTTTDVGADQLKFDIANSFQIQSRMHRLAPSADFTNDSDDGVGNALPFVYGGVLPTRFLANFLEPGLGWVKISNNPVNHWAVRGFGGMDVPVFLPMSKTVSVAPSIVRVFNGVDAPKFPTAMYARYSASRVVDGVTFTSGIQTIALANNTTTADVPFTVGVAQTQLQQISLNATHVWDSDSSPHSIARDGVKPIQLTFNTDAQVDDCESTIYRIDAGTAVPVRRFLSADVPATVPIEIDQSVFDHTSHYVIGVACHKGLPSVAHDSDHKGYDWRDVTYPFSESMIYSFTFVVP
ncbi:MAG: hypothetical protein ABI678_09270 [Kofleriaceae bacterium]